MFDTFADILQDFSPADLELIRAITSSRRVRRGEYLLRPGHTARELFFITEGILGIVVDRDRELTGYFLKEGQFCTLLASFHDQTPAEEGIRAACDAQVLVFAHPDLMALYKRLPAFEALVDHITHQTLLAKVQIRNAYFGLDAESRYKAFLERQPDVALRVSLTDIASYLEVTPQSLSRIRRQIKS